MSRLVNPHCLLGVMPPELIQQLGMKVTTIKRDPHYFLPTTDKRYLLFGSDQGAMEDQFKKFFSPEDFNANRALNQEISAIRDDVAKSWMQVSIRPPNVLR